MPPENHWVDDVKCIQDINRLAAGWHQESAGNSRKRAKSRQSKDSAWTIAKMMKSIRPRARRSFKASQMHLAERGESGWIRLHEKKNDHGTVRTRHDEPLSDLQTRCSHLAKLQLAQSSTMNIVESHAPNERLISKSLPFTHCVKVSAPIITVTLEALGITTFSCVGS